MMIKIPSITAILYWLLASSASVSSRKRQGFASRAWLVHRGGFSVEEGQVQNVAAFSTPTLVPHEENIPLSTKDIDKEPEDDSTTPARGYVLPPLFDAEDVYAAYTSLRDTYHQLSSSENHEWRVLKEKNGVEVSLLKHPSDPTCPYVRMKGIFPVPVEDCWNFLRVANWHKSMPKMDPFYEGNTMYQELNYKNISFILCRKCTKRILAFGKRDLVFLSVSDQPLEDGTWVSGTVSVVTEKIPRQDGYTRAFQDSVAFYKPLENNTKTEICITCRIDLNDSGEGGAGGFIPMWLYVKTIGRTGVQSIVRMRGALLDDLKQKSTTSADSSSTSMELESKE